jgi:hypothetical protein
VKNTELYDAIAQAVGDGVKQNAGHPDGIAWVNAGISLLALGIHTSGKSATGKPEPVTTSHTAQGVAPEAEPVHWGLPGGEDHPHSLVPTAPTTKLPQPDPDAVPPAETDTKPKGSNPKGPGH